MRYFTSEGDMLDAICAKHYGTTIGTVELVLNANPKLARQPEELPAGLVIDLPEFTAPSAPTVALWS